MAYEIPEMPPVEEMQEEKVPCIVMVDTSSSLHGYEKFITEGLETMKAAIEDDDMARGRVELCLIEFNSQAHLRQNFSLARNFEVPSIFCTGLTATHAAVRMAIDLANARKQQYRDEHVAYKQPWFWLFTDGGSNDEDNGAFEELLQMQQDKKAVFFGVAVGDDSHLANLGRMNKNGIYLQIDKDKFKAAFVYLSQSMSHVSSPTFNNTLTAPEDASVAAKQIPVGGQIQL